MVELRGVTMQYGRGQAARFIALADVDLCVNQGELTAVLGKSGSGKSTLLNLVAGLDRPTRGQVYVAGERIDELDEDALAIWRGQRIGVVFQFFQLLPTLSVVENVLLAMDFAAVIPRRARRERAHSLLDRVGMAAHANKLPAALSGGEQQRAAIARALANDPALVIADEPTGNLDSRTASAIIALFSRLVADGCTVLVVTHDRELARAAQRVVHLADGTIMKCEDAP